MLCSRQAGREGRDAHPVDDAPEQEAFLACGGAGQAALLSACHGTKHLEEEPNTHVSNMHCKRPGGN
jgi:hypothetical protein